MFLNWSNLTRVIVTLASLQIQSVRDKEDYKIFRLICEIILSWLETQCFFCVGTNNTITCLLDRCYLIYLNKINNCFHEQSRLFQGSHKKYIYFFWNICLVSVQVNTQLVTSKIGEYILRFLDDFALNVLGNRGRFRQFGKYLFFSFFFLFFFVYVYTRKHTHTHMKLACRFIRPQWYPD